MCWALVSWLDSQQNSLLSYSESKETDGKHTDQGSDSTRPDRCIPGFVGHKVSVSTAELYCCSTKAAIDNI